MHYVLILDRLYNIIDHEWCLKKKLVLTYSPIMMIVLLFQETRVCERIDEVDCSKSEQFYSLNLELYGNSQPSILEGK